MEIAGSLAPAGEYRLTNTTNRPDEGIEPTLADQGSSISFAALVEHSSDATLVVTRDGTVAFANAAASRLFSIARASLISLELVGLFPGEAMAEFLDAALNTREGLVRAQLELRNDGKPVRLVETIASQMSPADTRIIVSFRDVTEKRNAEDGIRLLSQVVETMNVGLYVWRLDDLDDVSSLRLVATNHAASEVTGMPADDIAGRRLEEIFPTLHELGIDRHLAEVIRTGETRDLGEFTYGSDRIRASIFHSRVFPLPDQSAGLVLNDITERKQAELELREKEERLRSILETTTEWVWETDPSGTITYSNPAVSVIIGWSADELLDTSSFDLVDDEVRLELERRLRRAVHLKRPWSAVVTRLKHRDGTLRWVESSGAPLFDDEGELTGFRGVYRDITERRIAEERLQYQLYHDSVTDLPNRLLFYDRLTLSVVRAQRDGDGLAVMYIDIDHFKVVNDSLGHIVGDALLRSLARRLQSFLRVDDTVARSGADEFMILVPTVARPVETSRLAQRIVEGLAEPFMVDGNQIYITVSVGISMHPSDGSNAETLLKNAETAMYGAKDLGRNTFQIFAPALNERYRDRLALEMSLRQAIDKSEFVLHYQPLIDVATWNMIGVEALIRWNHPVRGLVRPDEFIPLAEDTRMIVPIGDWVLRSACTQAKAWLDAGHPPMRVSVNLSAAQLHHGDLIQSMERALADTNFDPHYVELEITESVAMEDAERTLKALRDVRAMGVTIAVDDFGTGQSSLAYLTRFPINTVKIDRAFVGNLTRDSADAAVVSAVVALAHSLKLRVVAEGVETAEQLEFLRKERCDEMQGFYFSRPVPSDDLTPMLGRLPSLHHRHYGDDA